MNAQIVLENIGVHFANRLLFEEVNWTLYEGMRVSLAGRNGSGKSTLMKILAGAGDPTQGKRTVVGSRKLRVGFLDQSLLDSAVVEALEQKDKSQSAVDYIKTRHHGSLDQEISAEEIEWETKKILQGLGYSQRLMSEPISHLSGGWLLRMFIAAALLEKPEVLLLDEPTNHLDLSSIQWLEEFLTKEFKGSLVLITHDIALQKRTTDSLAILHGGRFYFRKHQQDYLTFRESLGEEKRLLEKAIETNKKKIDENLDFAMRFRAKAQTAARAQSKLKIAERLKEDTAILEDRLMRVEGFSYNLKFSFRLSGAGSKYPVSLKALSFRYSDHSPWILKDVSLDIKRGQKIAIIGDNGTGKTTLLNVLAERLNPTTGEVLKGFGTSPGYFGQHQLDELSLEDSLLDNLRVKANGIGLEQLRGWLGAFGFSGQESVTKKVKVLSGGERARLALLRILVTPINVCLLDEPTNHLDIETKELLKKAICDFEGTVMIVSHDREFLGDVAERIIYLSQDHTLTDHLGNLQSFFEKYPELIRHIEGKAKASTLLEDSENKKPSPSQPPLSYEERKKAKNQIRSLERKVSQLEHEIETIGHEKAAIEKQADHGQVNAYSKIGQLDTDLHTKMLEWERLSSDLEELRIKYPDLK